MVSIASFIFCFVHIFLYGCIQAVIARVQSLKESGDLTGVIDDRGKFIYISPDEMEAVSVFIRQRGRVSIAELVSSSNILINLQPDQPAIASV